ncbi:hypothetical protein JRO89_XS03G0253900 [Xanthoceras sorbifolium]|uniref:Sugar phosphate transporter domain-containing protein n=1 Tax=Xanthoceras sorbifolium TaxID=99658 RepID=A0ABQ8IBT0_9ROSI|nr:hypothetical protein JRO89_XS03G0253900 [Xanthoceras sorbifolium]
MASDSSKTPILPISGSPKDEEKERLLKGDERLFKGSAMTKRGANAAISYMTCAVLLILFNKAALSSYNFPSGNVITLFQMISSCSFLYVLRRWKVITFMVGESLTTSDSNSTFVSFRTMMHTLPVAVTYLLYMLATVESIRGVNVPMYTTLRRTTVAFTMIVEYVLTGQKYTPPIIGRSLTAFDLVSAQYAVSVTAKGCEIVCLKCYVSDSFTQLKKFKGVISVGLIVLGAFIAGARDLSFDFYGYAVVFLANIATAIYLATIARIGKSSGLNSFGLMWCNGIPTDPNLKHALGLSYQFPA